jgi:UDP-N-acetylglucosamine--N-acetylmuramyl-(pentapeptide) pyrophosphoryl-undecaprenol N-acetylglucosamine transferase
MKTDAPLRILFAGGGTGGHLFPGIALAETFTARNPENRVLFVGPGKPMEREALAAAGFDSRTIDVEGFKRRGPVNQIRALAKLPLAVAASKRILNEFRPHLILGLGGYSAGPVAVAARLAAIPVVLHEQNMLPGITNRLLAPLAERIYVSFDRTRIAKKYADRVRVFGNPVRREIMAEGERDKGTEGQRKNGCAFTVAVLGGSQGAHAVNMAMIEAAGLLKDRERIRVIHQTGPNDADAVADAYHGKGISADVRPFFRDMAPVYAAADLIICRAGATTVAEVTALGKPAIFIPFPFAADDHQFLNAQGPAEAGGAELIRQERATGHVLADRIDHYADHPDALRLMAERSRRFGQPDAARRIVADIYQLLGDV